MTCNRHDRYGDRHRRAAGMVYCRVGDRVQRTDVVGPERQRDECRVLRGPGRQTRDAHVAHGLHVFPGLRQVHQVHRPEQTIDRYLPECGQGNTTDRPTERDSARQSSARVRFGILNIDSQPIAGNYSNEESVDFQKLITFFYSSSVGLTN